MASSNSQGAARTKAALRQYGQNLADFTSWPKKCSFPGLAAPGICMGKSRNPNAYSFFA
jgi:hypothetical protein